MENLKENKELKVQETTTAEVAENNQNLTIEMIKKYICPKATDQEAFMFLQLCRIQGLNPFLREAYLIKYGDEPAMMVTGKETFTKRADKLQQYNGFRAGIIVLDNTKKLVYREGSFVIAGEKLLGGWAEVYRKDRGIPFRNEVSLAEYERRKKDGTLMQNWKMMPATMIRKVALVQSLREAFPNEFGGLYSPEEMPVDTSAMPVYHNDRPPVIVQEEEVNNVQVTEEVGERDTESNENKVITKITLVGQQVRKKDGTLMKSPLYIIRDGDKDYKTFSAALAKTANEIYQAGKMAEITYKIDKFGNIITNITAVEDATENSEVSDNSEFFDKGE